MYTKEQLEIVEMACEISFGIALINELKEPKMEFILKKDENILIGLRNFENEEPDNYVIDLKEPSGALMKVRKKSDLEENEPEMNCMLEAIMLQKLSDGFEIVSINVEYHFAIWSFFDMFVQDLPYVEDGMHVYLGYCQEHGITEKFIASNSMIPTTDYFSAFPPRIVHNGTVYSHIIKQKIDNEELCLSYLGVLNTTEDFRVILVADGIVSDIKSFKTLEEASKLYIELYRLMTSNGEMTAKHVFEYMSDFLSEEKNGKELPSGNSENS